MRYIRCSPYSASSPFDIASGHFVADSGRDDDNLECSALNQAAAISKKREKYLESSEVDFSIYTVCGINMKQKFNMSVPCNID